MFFWKRKGVPKKKKGLFGGAIASDKEIRKLHQHIQHHEAEQLQEAEAQLEEDLKAL